MKTAPAATNHFNKKKTSETQITEHREQRTHDEP